jgi:hypothetical protein
MNARPRFRLMSLSLLIVLLFSGFITTRQVYANSSVNVEISTFHDALAPYGNWVNHPLYGQVWYPRNVAQDWRPYTDGYWAHTDDYGWLWVSYEPWGWAPFHYERWAWDNWYGWVWVPGRTWAPAWVFWRSGGGYAAWAPMPPNVVWQPGVGLNISYFNYDRDLRWDSWVAVREYDLPNRHISRHISPPSQNRQVINVTNYTNNVTLINNTIVNQGVPVKQIEEVTRRPVESVVPKVHDRVDINTAEHQDGQPDIIRLPMAAPTHEEIQHNEELARRLDGKNADGARAELPVADVEQSGNQESRLPGRLVGAPTPVQSPYATPEHINPALTEPIEQTLPQPAIPKTPLVGLSLDPDPQQHKEPKVGSHQEALVPTQRSDQQSSATIQPIAPASPQVDSVSAPVSATDQKSVLTDTATMPPLQNERQPSGLAERPDNQPLQDSVANQQQIERQQSENLQRQQKIDQLQQELARRQDKQKQQEAVIQQQQVERAVEPAQQMRQPEATRQPEMQNQPQEMQPQQVEHAAEPAQQIRQPEATRQPEMQNQPQEMQTQQVEHAAEPAQQIQQQESARQPEMQNQPQEMQPQQVERTVEPVQQIQQQEPARQPEMQNQPQEMQSKQVDHAVAPAQQIQQQESARQPEMQNQPQEMQPKQVDHAVAPVQQIQQQESARQPEMQNQPQEMQPQQVERAVEPTQQIQQQESARQPEMQNQPQEMQPQQVERATEPAPQIQQQEPMRQPDMQNQPQPQIQLQPAKRAVEPTQQIQQQEPTRQPDMQNQPQPQIQPQPAERATEPAQQMQLPEAARQPGMQNQQ